MGTGGARNGNRNAEKHGLHRLKDAVKALGGRVIDRRTTLGKALVRWRADLVKDLGGADALSTQQLALVDLAVTGRLLLNSVDAWLLMQPTLINARKRALLPVVKEREQLAEGLARRLAQLGLERKAKPVTDIAALFAEIHRRAEDGEDDEADSPPPASGLPADGNSP